ncbi:hypothetical protein SLA2020_055830 [Shorea laevis]
MTSWTPVLVCSGGIQNACGEEMEEIIGWEEEEGNQTTTTAIFTRPKLSPNLDWKSWRGREGEEGRDTPVFIPSWSWRD